MNWVHWWNTQRLHQALGYATPAGIEATYYQARAATPALTWTPQPNPVRFKHLGLVLEHWAPSEKLRRVDDIGSRPSEYTLRAWA